MTPPLGTFRTFPSANFPEGSRPGHILALGDRLSSRGLKYHAFKAAGDSFSTYRMAVYNLSPILSVAVEIEITGRTVQYDSGGCPHIKALITFVGDGEPNTYAKGWVRL